MGKAGRTAAGLAGAILLAAALGQVLLPRIAADRISSRLSRYGTVKSVSVHAWPAIELLWGHADSVAVAAGSLRMSPAQTANLLWEARGIDSLDMSAERARAGTLSLTEVSLRKRGDALSAQASMTQAAVSAALPQGLSVRLLGSAAGEVEVQASGGLFGVPATLNAVAGASEGKLIVHPLGLLLEGLKLTLFAEPHIYVRGVGASPSGVPGAAGGYRLAMTASLR